MDVNRKEIVTLSFPLATEQMEEATNWPIVRLALRSDEQELDYDVYVDPTSRPKEEARILAKGLWQMFKEYNKGAPFSEQELCLIFCDAGVSDAGLPAN